MSVVAAVALMALVALAVALSSAGPLTATAVAVGAALALSAIATVVIGPRVDGHQASFDEVVLCTAILLAPQTLPWAALAFAVLFPILAPTVGVLQRMRRTTAPKRVFNVSATVLGYLSAFAVAVGLVRTGISPEAAALLGGLTHWAVTSVLTLAVMSAAAGRFRPSAAFASFRESLTPNVLGSLLGLAVAALTVDLGRPGAVALATAAVVYAIARYRLPRVLSDAAHVEVLDNAHAIIGAHDVDEAITSGAAALLSAGRAELRPQPPEAPMEVGVRIGDHPASPWLVVSERLGVTPRFDGTDEMLLRSFARLGAPARAHARAVERLERADGTRAAILGALGHDLRHPMAVAGIAGRTLTDRGDQLDSVAKSRLVEVIVANLDRSAVILDDLLELERRALVDADDEPASVGEILGSLLDVVGETVTLVPGPPAAVQTDPRLLGRVLDNLVQNAVRHAPGSEVVVWWWVSGDEVVIAVDDAGPGISDEDRERLLEPFASGSKQGVGVGLGLYLARRFTELAGGDLQIGVSDRGGASVRVVLPAAELRIVLAGESGAASLR